MRDTHPTQILKYQMKNIRYEKSTIRDITHTVQAIVDEVTRKKEQDIHDNPGRPARES